MQAVGITQLRSNIKNYFDDGHKSEEALILPRTSEEDRIGIIPLPKFNALHERGCLFLYSFKNSKKLQGVIH